MDDLVSRDALLEKSETIYTEADGVLVTASVVTRTDIVMAPAVDAEPVRRGHWIKCNGKSHIWYCSECGDRINYNQARRTYKPGERPVSAVNKYCRCYGAKMEEG